MLFTFCKTPDKQKVEAILSSEKEIYILDTVSIIEPVLVEFEDTLALTNEFMILSSSEFDSIVRMKPKMRLIQEGICILTISIFLRF